jgi:hypothetical protein
VVPFSALLYTIAVIGEQLDPCRDAPCQPARRAPRILTHCLLFVNNYLSLFVVPPFAALTQLPKSIDLASSFQHNDGMLRLTKSFWTVPVWMTAFTTLIASISPCQCVCPDGNRKLFCLGITCGTKGCCCCCGACCGGALPDGGSPKAERPCLKVTNQRCCCCCPNSSPRDSATTAEHKHVQGKGCRLTLSSPKIVTESRKDIAINEGSAVMLFREVPSPALPISLTCPWVWSSETYHPPPPPDLIVTFQHFII